MNALTSGNWLNRDRVSAVATISAVLGVAMLLFTWFAGKGSVDAFGQPVGADFTAFWNAGRLAIHGQAASAWNPDILNADVLATHGVSYTTAWLYPPVFLLLIAPLATLPYLVALLVWQLAGLAALALALRPLLPDRRALLIALASPLAPMILANGQNSFVTASLLCTGLLFLKQRPTLAGACLGGLIYKPQLALLILPLLLITRSWRAMVAASVTGILLIGASLLIWGVESWYAFLGATGIAHALLEQAIYGLHKSVSIFSMMRAWGAPLSVGYGAQALGAVAAIALVWKLRAAPDYVRAAGVCAGVLLSTPYLLDYDMVAVGIGAVFLYAEARRNGFLPYERSALAFIWFAPWFSRPAAEFLTLPLGQMATILLAVLVVRRARAAQGIAIPPLTCKVCPVT